MIDLQQIAMLSVFPLGAIVLGLWGLYLNRRSPEQVKADELEAVLMTQQELRELNARIKEIEHLLVRNERKYHALKSSVTRDATTGRFFRVRPETREAYHRLVLHSS